MHPHSSKQRWASIHGWCRGVRVCVCVCVCGVCVFVCALRTCVCVMTDDLCVVLGTHTHKHAHTREESSASLLRLVVQVFTHVMRVVTTHRWLRVSGTSWVCYAPWPWRSRPGGGQLKSGWGCRPTEFILTSQILCILQVIFFVVCCVCVCVPVCVVCA